MSLPTPLNYSLVIQNLNDGNTSEFNESISTSVSETVISWMNES